MLKSIHLQISKRHLRDVWTIFYLLKDVLKTSKGRLKEIRFLNIFNVSFGELCCLGYLQDVFQIFVLFGNCTKRLKLHVSSRCINILTRMKYFAKIYAAAGTIMSLSFISNYLTFMDFFVCSLSRYTDHRRYRFESWEQSTNERTRVTLFTNSLSFSEDESASKICAHYVYPNYAAIMYLWIFINDDCNNEFKAGIIWKNWQI